MNISFEGKVALVTGAASGLGLATTRAFAESGAAVALADWNEKAVQAAAKELTERGHKTLAVTCDVSDDAQVGAMVEKDRRRVRPAGRGLQQCRRSKRSCGNGRFAARRLRSRDVHQSTRRLELHEV